MTFAKGQSGNPAGRAKGNIKTASLRKALIEHAPGIIEQLVLAAKLGDVQAAKIILDRVCPALKPVSMDINLNLNALTLAEKASQLFDAMAKGELSPDAGSILTNQLMAQCRIIETDELVKRIEALENPNNEY